MRYPRSEALALRPTPLGALDARVKFLLTLAYTFAVVSVPFDRPHLLAPLGIPLALAIGAGDVPLGYLVRRLLLGLPFVILVILFPLLLQRERVTLLIGEETIPLTQGAIRSAGVAGKFVLAFSAVITLSATTGFTKICDAMARLRFPTVFVSAVSMVWRYLFVLLEEVQRMRQARDARCGSKMSLGLAWSSSAAIVGNLFLRALLRSERVHAAMSARGFTGALPRVKPSRMRAADWGILSAGIALLAGWLVLL
ncbi:MAG: cobalt ECF transporter T component CbiQ, partial [Planctomycetota bacterium]